jgi:hypothetical protein
MSNFEALTFSPVLKATTASPIMVWCKAIGVTAVRDRRDVDGVVRAVFPGRGVVAVVRSLSTLLSVASFRASASRRLVSLSAIPRRWA